MPVGYKCIAEKLKPKCREKFKFVPVLLKTSERVLNNTEILLHRFLNKFSSRI
nr:ORF26 [Bracoviriform inaniti]